MSSFNPSTHKLAGSEIDTGGLILKGKKNSQPESKDSDSIFKKPTASLLGLDRLARKKREEREIDEVSFPEKKARAYFKDEKSNSYDPDVRISFGRSSKVQDSARDKKYRGPLVETPTHTGGVSEEALQRIHSRLIGRDQRTHGVYASTTRDDDRVQNR